jgi:hypothetical protein
MLSPLATGPLAMSEGEHVRADPSGRELFRLVRPSDHLLEFAPGSRPVLFVL